jgi:hypothetical protein
MSMQYGQRTVNSSIDSRFPIGRFDLNAVLSSETRHKALNDIEILPRQLRTAVAGMTEPQLDTSYRQDGWTIRQLVHHVADSHMNAYIRTKLAITEKTPTIKPFDQDLWSELRDSHLPIQCSLSILEGVHIRWTEINAALDEHSLARRFVHPELGSLTVDAHIHLYAWHGRHHLAHITNLMSVKGW